MDATLSEARAVFDVNVFGVFEVTQTFSSMLIDTKGTIVNIGSIVARIPFPYMGLYNASKAALEQLSRSMRIEYAPFDVRVIHVRNLRPPRPRCTETEKEYRLLPAASTPIFSAMHR